MKRKIFLDQNERVEAREKDQHLVTLEEVTMSHGFIRV